jgi:hypothetical protein
MFYYKWLYIPFIGPLPSLKFVDPIYSRKVTISVELALRKASTNTQENTDTEE